MATIDFGGVKEEVVMRDEFPMSKALDVLKQVVRKFVDSGGQADIKRWMQATEITESGVILKYEDQQGGHEITVDKVVVAVGRRPETFQGLLRTVHSPRVLRQSVRHVAILILHVDLDLHAGFEVLEAEGPSAIVYCAEGETYRARVVAFDVFGASILVVATGPTVTTGARDRDRLREYFARLPRRDDLTIVWRPTGLWEPEAVQGMARSLGITGGFDAIDDPAPQLDPAGRQLGAGVVVDLFSKDPAQATTVWVAIDSVLSGLGGGNEIVGGLWVLLLSWAALRSGKLPKVLNYLGVLVGLAGILTVVPAFELLMDVFGLGQIVWFAWLGIVMLRNDPSAT